LINGGRVEVALSLDGLGEGVHEGIGALALLG